MSKVAKAILSSGSRKTIICCPSCSTKFAVSAEALSAHEFPRFHCSRCDHLFGLDENSVMEGAPNNLQEQSVSNGHSAQERHDIPAPVEQESPPLSEPMAWSSSSRQPVVATAPMPSDPVIRPIAEPVVETKIEERSDLEIPQIAFDFGRAAKAERPAGVQFSSKNLDFEIPVPKPKQKKKTEEPASEKGLFSNKDSRPLSSEMPRTSSVAKVSGPWASFLMILSPILLFLSGLTAVSLYLRSDAQAGEQFMELLMPASLHTAPTGLQIINARMKTVTLDSGERVNIISGSLINQSEKRLKDVMIQGLALNQAGLAIASANVSASSTLAKTRIKSLTPEMIRNVQSKEGAKRYELRPGDEQEFAIALLDDAVAEAPYFAARVYSVRY